MFNLLWNYLVEDFNCSHVVSLILDLINEYLKMIHYFILKFSLCLTLPLIYFQCTSSSLFFVGPLSWSTLLTESSNIPHFENQQLWIGTKISYVNVTNKIITIFLNESKLPVISVIIDGPFYVDGIFTLIPITIPRWSSIFKL